MSTQDRPAGDAAPVGLPDVVIALIRRERYRFDAVGAPVPRSVTELRSLLALFYGVELTAEQINAALGQ